MTIVGPEMSGSTPWTLDQIGRDERVLDLLVPTLRGPGVEAFEPQATVRESATTVTIEVTQRIRFPGPKTHYTGFPTSLQVVLGAPLADRRLVAAPIDKEAFPDWFGPGWQPDDDIETHRFGREPDELV